MPRRKGRNATPTTTTTSSPSTAAKVSPATTATTGAEPSERISFEDVFARFRDPAVAGEEEEDAVVGPDGLERLCGELGVDPSSRALLVFAQQCGCSEMGVCRKDELRAGLEKLGWKPNDSYALKKVGTSIKTLDRSIKDAGRSSALFLDLYKFTFDLCKASKQAKVVDKTVAAPMLALVLGEDAPHVKSFVTFLEESAECKVLNIDQWLCFLQFSNSVDEALVRYSDEDSWPSLLDEFVEFKRKAVEASC